MDLDSAKHHKELGSIELNEPIIQNIIQKPFKSFVLTEVLNSSTQGTMIINYFKSNNKLNDSIRTMLVDVIINHVITLKISMSVSLADSIATQIEALFNTEVKVNKNKISDFYYFHFNIIFMRNYLLGYIFHERRYS